MLNIRVSRSSTVKVATHITIDHEHDVIYDNKDKTILAHLGQIPGRIYDSLHHGITSAAIMFSLGSVPLSKEQTRDEVELRLAAFADQHRQRGIPPPYILLCGADEAQNVSIAQEFANQLGVEFASVDAATIQWIGDLTTVLWGKRVAYLGNIHLLRKAFSNKLARDLHEGEWEILIGTGPSIRKHVVSLDTVAIIATSPSRYDLPAPLAREFRCVLPVTPLTPESLRSLLEAEARKGKISLDSDAAHLLIESSEGRSDILLARFRKLVTVIKKVKVTTEPHLTRTDIADAMARFRIEVPSRTPLSKTLVLQKLTGQEFEILVKRLLVNMGFEAELTAVTGDGGIDIVASVAKPFYSGKYLFQCKRYSAVNLVGAAAVRDFYGAVVANKALKGILITTSDFTAQARDFAKLSGVELIKLGQLRELLEQHGLGECV